jgi:hypothetical protein
MTQKTYVERRLYYAGHCSKCNNPYKSFHRSRIKGGLCRKCRKGAVPKDQMALL